MAAILLVSLVSLGEGRDEGATIATPRAAPSAGEVAQGNTASPVEPATSTAPGVTEDPASKISQKPSQGYPANLLQLPKSVTSALVFDLHDNRMHIFDGHGKQAERVGDFFVAVGKQGLEKRAEGDEKTPLGIYFVSSYIPGEKLPAIYGEGAFPIDYPNAWDRRLGRTGSGIWIHGTDKDEKTLLPQSSRGCLTLRNADFLNLAKFVRIQKTPVIVSGEVSWTSPEALRADRDSLAAAVENWRKDWESLETDRYLGHYSESFQTDSMTIRSWRTHKRRVNASKAYIRVGIDDVGIYAYPGEPGLYLVTFEQTYRSSNFQGRKWKQQYWRREAGEWRILHEDGT